MRINHLIIGFCISVCISCSSNKQNRTWIPVFVEEDLELKVPLYKGAYGITINFLSDSIYKFHNIKSNIQGEVKVKHAPDKRIKILKSDRKYYDFAIENISKDSLTISYLSNLKDEKDFKVKYIPQPISEFNNPINELKFMLINNFWEYEIGDWRYELEFNYSIKEDRGLRGDYNTAYKCIIHLYEKGQYKSTINYCYWSLVKVDKSYILHIGENPHFSYTFQTFYITSILENSFNTVAWYQNKKADIKFKKLPFQLDIWIDNYNNLTSKNWNVSHTEILKNNNAFPDSIEYYLSRLKTWDTVDTDLVISTSDLESKVLTYSFRSDHSFKLYKLNQVILSGEWYLYPNGKVVRLTKDEKTIYFNSDSYFVTGSDMYISDINSNGSIIYKQEEIYINDSTFINKETKQFWK